MTQEGTRVPLRVLLVEDDEDDYVLVRDALEALGPERMTLEWIDDAERALAAMMAGRHDVCLLDNRLGAYTGLELLELARQRGWHTPVILLTGIEDQAADQRALESGAADFLVKSQVTPVLLERAIRYAVEHARTLEVLRRSQASFRELIERLPDGVSVWQDGRLIYANPELLRLVGVASSQELVGKRAKELSALVHPEDLPRLAHLNAAPPTERLVVEVRFLRKSGDVIPVEVAQFPVTFEGRSCSMGIARDLTERKQMQARLTAADQMATLGMAAGVVAHDINNPLAYMLTNLHHLATDVLPRLSLPEQERDEVGMVLADVQHGAARAREIVQQFRIFSRGEKDVRIEPVDVRRVIESALRMSQNAIRHRARLVRDDAEPLVVAANEGQLGQVVLNLLINAAQAIPEGDAARHQITLTTRMEDGRVVAEVSDTGRGMGPEVLERAFEPFFTTKSMGEGMGLGLSICLGLVQSMKGELTATSKPGVGSTFRVVLPPGTQQAQILTPTALAKTSRRRRVLIIDDEPGIAAVFRRIIGRSHEVVVVQSGREALELLEKDEAFDRIFCDLMMADLTGMDVYESLASRQRECLARFVFMTGGSFTERARTFLQTVPFPRIDKPFDPQHIRDLVAQSPPPPGSHA